MENKTMKKTILFVLAALILAGCATSVRYVRYTDEKLPPKPKYYFITVYDAQPPTTNAAYRIIGKVEISGYTNAGVTPEMLLDQAKAIAVKKGADAIINARTQAFDYSGVDVSPGYFHHHFYRPPAYYYYTNTLLTFSGELIVFQN